VVLFVVLISCGVFLFPEIAGKFREVRSLPVSTHGHRKICRSGCFNYICLCLFFSQENTKLIELLQKDGPASVMKNMPEDVKQALREVRLGESIKDDHPTSTRAYTDHYPYINFAIDMNT
jgi:hypothetical protein